MTSPPAARLDCYVRDSATLDIHPAPASRAWMDESPNRHAYRCLPLSIANAHGWEIRLARTVRITWSGGPLTTDLVIETVESPDDPPPGDTPTALSAFGSGIATFYVPALFRTEPGYNLWVTGPVNHFIDGLAPLTAVVETDWLTEYGFTMNWKVTRAGHTVELERGTPYCFIMPVPRGLCEAFAPRMRRLTDEPELHEQYYGAERARSEFQASIGVSGAGGARYVADENRDAWQRRYFQGIDAGGRRVSEHQTKLSVRPFDREL